MSDDPNKGYEEDYDFIGLTQLRQSLVLSSRRRQKMGSYSQGAIVHTVHPRKNAVSVFEHNIVYQ